MNVKYAYSFVAVVALFLIAYVGVAGLGLEVLFGVIFPCLAVIIFIVGFVMKVMNWARSAVPFRITTTCGQQKSMPWVKPARIDNPFSKGAVVVRMALEILFFRSLFRNTKVQVQEGDKVIYRLEIWLWLFALLFHWAFFVVLVRHLRFFMDPVPLPITLIEAVDGFFRLEILYDFIQFGLPGVFISGLVLLGAVTFLFLRRVLIPQVRYISLTNDYFPLLLIAGIALSGILMRYFSKVNITAVKELTMGLVTFRFTVPDGIGVIFYIHVFLVSVLLAYFPFSKLMHLGGIFMSPTRNMPADTRATRHENPWNYPVPVHTYEEYEDEFRERMVEAGLPVVKQPEPDATAEEAA